MFTIYLLFALTILQTRKADNECIGGKLVSFMSKSEYLKEFAKGPCSPFMILPGVLSTKLVVEIDCPVLKAENPEIFEACGWNDCSQSATEFWKSIPDSEYQLWIPSYTSPMAIFTFGNKSNQCWAKLIRQVIDFTEPIDKAVQVVKGVKISTYGSTPRTHTDFECGDRSISNILSAYLQIPQTRTFGPMIAAFRKMGYVAGLTYQSLPYNFNKPLVANELSPAFADNLERLNTLTRKKVTVISHSFGGLNTYYQLNKLDREYRKRVIKQWIPIATPFLGGTKAFKIALSADDNFMYLNNIFGLELRAAIEGVSSTIGTFQLLSKDPYSALDNVEWFQAIKKRTLYEEGLLPYEMTDYKFLPPKGIKCSPANFADLPQDCILGLYDTSKDFTVQVGADSFKMNEADKLFAKYDIVKNANSIYGLVEDRNLFEFKNPEVPILSINLRTALTTQKLVYGPDLMDSLITDTYHKPIIVYGYGDKTVDAYSQFIPLLKWAKEYDDGEQHSNPVKIVDLCSIYKEKYEPFDDFYSSGEKKMNKNEFFGISCDCIESDSPVKCNHGLMIQDTSIIRLLKNALDTNEISYNEDYNSYIDSLQPEYLETVSVKCPQVVYN